VVAQWDQHGLRQPGAASAGPATRAAASSVGRVTGCWAAPQGAARSPRAAPPRRMLRSRPARAPSLRAGLWRDRRAGMEQWEVPGANGRSGPISSRGPP